MAAAAVADHHDTDYVSRRTAALELIMLTDAVDLVHTFTKGGRSLQDHLVGTETLLRKAGYPVAVCIAGLLHSIYGTERLRYACILADLDGRARVRNTVGEYSERLCFLFHVVLRPPALHDLLLLHGEQLGSLNQVELRTAAGSITVSREDFFSLLAIEVANKLEQGGFDEIEYPLFRSSETYWRIVEHAEIDETKPIIERAKLAVSGLSGQIYFYVSALKAGKLSL
jgi:hypothetical protein